MNARIQPLGRYKGGASAAYLWWDANHRSQHRMRMGSLLGCQNSKRKALSVFIINKPEIDPINRHKLTAVGSKVALKFHCSSDWNGAKFQTHKQWEEPAARWRHVQASDTWVVNNVIEDQWNDKRAFKRLRWFRNHMIVDSKSVSSLEKLSRDVNLLSGSSMVGSVLSGRRSN